MTGGDSNAKRKAALESVRERQRRFKAIRHAKGLKRVTLWVPIEDVEELKLAAGDGPAFDRLRQAALAGLQAEISELLDEAAGRRNGKGAAGQAHLRARRRRCRAGRDGRAPERPDAGA